MNNLKLNQYLDIANAEKENRGLVDYTPLYPMLRVESEKLYVGVMLTSMDENVWDKAEKIKPRYWMLIDVETKKVVEFNKTSDKDFVIGQLVSKNFENKQKEISKYLVNKRIQYKKYLMDDIKDNQLLLVQQKVSSLLNDEILVDGEKANINDYLMANIGEEIENKINELVDLLIQTKYGSIMFYYDCIFDNVIREYLTDGIINKDKIELCIEIINNYYDGVIGIDNFFNIV